MLGHTLALAFRGLSVYRWNNFPRIEQVSATDHIAFSLHISILLTFIIEEEKGIIFDRDYIFRKVLFSSFSTFVHSDISSEVKDQVKKKDPKMYNELENIVYEMFRSWKLPEWMKKDMREIHDFSKQENHFYQKEDDLIAFSKLWASYHEAYFSNEAYLDVYRPAMDTIEQKIQQPKFDLFRSYIDLNPKNQNNIERFLLSMRRLQSSYRWNSMRRRYPVSVMSHLFITSFIAYIIGNIEEKDEQEVTHMMMVALFHDIPEAITGDIVTPTKKAIGGFEELLVTVEKELVDKYLLGYIRKYRFSVEYEKLMLEPWGQTNGKLVKLADNFSALFEAKIEASVDEEFAKVYKDLKKFLHSSPYQSVDHLFKFGIDYFEDNIEDIIRLKKT
ncbi:MAG: HD domain-containing protein [Candidatus Gracilibacteria bacterium]|nr:HD domain-containing protein [Candidatus Gracilibacteria bacterium]